MAKQYHRNSTYHMHRNIPTDDTLYFKNYYDTAERKQKSFEAGQKRALQSNDYMDKKYPNRKEDYNKSLIEREIQLTKLNEYFKETKQPLIDSITQYAYDYGVEESLIKYDKDLKTYEKQAKLYSQMATGVSADKYSNLFYCLAKEIPEFAIYAPVECFTKTSAGSLLGYIHSMNLIKLTNNDLLKLEKRLEDICPSIFKDEIFKKNYIKYFPHHINEITNNNQLIQAIKKYPHMYKNLKNSKKEELFKISGFFSVISKSPELIKYLTKKEIQRLLDANFSSVTMGVGAAIVKYPTCLKILDDKFFIYNPPKLLFSGITYKELSKISSYLVYFPTLYRYYQNKALLTKSHKGLPIHKKTPEEKQAIIVAQLAGLDVE